MLKFKLGDLRDGTTRRVDLVCRDISQQDEEGLLFLRREQIRFYVEAENADTFTYAGWTPLPCSDYELKKNYPWTLSENLALRKNSVFREWDIQETSTKACCKLEDQRVDLPCWWGQIPDLSSREQLESLWWLPALDRIAPGFPPATQAKPEVLPSYRGPFPEGLIARVECLGGRLRTFDFNRGVNGLPIPWRFAPPQVPSGPGTWNQALSNSLALEFFDVRGAVHIELRRLANEVVIEELVLAPAPGASRPVMEISISNREPDLLFQEEGFSRSSLPDVDFQPIYEKLSRFREGGIQIADLPIPHPARDMFFGIREKPCAGGYLLG